MLQKTKKYLSYLSSVSLLVYLILVLTSCNRSRQPGNKSVPQTISENHNVKPMDGTAWIEEEGIRGIWVHWVPGKGINNKYNYKDVLNFLAEANCNVLILQHYLSDFLDLNSAHWEEGILIVDYNKVFVDSLLKITEDAAKKNIRTFFCTTNNLNEMLPTLKRLGYNRAYIEGPARYVPAGSAKDASPFDKTLWEGLIGAHGEHIARLSTKYPIAGILYDTEHYGGGIMYLQGCGFGDDSFVPYLRERGIHKSPKDTPAGTRYKYLANNGLLYDYWNYLEEKIYIQGRTLEKRWHAVNPNLFLGIWPLIDNWFSRGFLRGIGGEVPSLGLSGVEYGTGASQTKSMAEYFESNIPNMKYMPGFMDNYDSKELEHNIKQAIEASAGRYWMLILLEAKTLQNRGIPSALNNAYAKSQKIKTLYNQPPVDLEYKVIHTENEPGLVVQTQQKKEQFKQIPLLTIRGACGGATLCKDLLMKCSESGHYYAEIPLVRLLTNNLEQENSYRSGVSYEYNPVPRRIRGEDTQHTKLTDGRAFGFAGTTAMWGSDINHAEVIFDLHREYKITRVELSQHRKLEDGFGGPTEVVLDMGMNENEWSHSIPFTTLSTKHENKPSWLNWFAEDINKQARWLRIRLDKIYKNTDNGETPNIISLGEVMIWGEYNGEIQTTIKDGDDYRLIRNGKSFKVEDF